MRSVIIVVLGLALLSSCENTEQFPAKETNWFRPCVNIAMGAAKEYDLVLLGSVGTHPWLTITPKSRDVQFTELFSPTNCTIILTREPIITKSNQLWTLEFPAR